MCRRLRRVVTALEAVKAPFMKRKRTFRFTRAGKLFVGLTFGAGVAAVNTGNNLLYLVLGLMLSTLVVSGILSEQALRRLWVGRRLPTRAFAGQPCLVTISVENRKHRLPSHALSVRAGDSTTPPLVHILKVGPGETQVRTHRFVPPRRGLVPMGPLQVVTRFPFGLVEKGRRVPMDDALLVYPALVKAPDASPSVMPERAEAMARGVGVGSEVAGIREYRSGDEARIIHWGRTASLGKVVVRERHQDAVARLVLEVDDARRGEDGDPPDEAFEQALRVAGSQTVRALAQGTAVQVRAGGRRSPVVRPGAAPDPILEFLALLEPAP
jgi:uncharacterized protein (DUF58 family)